jgi:ring-1,2-phenylacetyl-CoA epoxidase subunit PaaD
MNQQVLNIAENISYEEAAKKNILEILDTVYDPEIPVLSVVDLGIVRDVLISFSMPIPIWMKKELEIEVIITPTYSGCPAMDVISINIKMALLQNGFKNVKITQQLSPAWTTDWMSENGKQKLKAYGIAAPQARSDNLPSDRINKMFLDDEITVQCPQCNSGNTKILSQFGSTACKALYQCNECKEPFDYFKCH